MNCKMCGGVTLADRTIRTRSDGTCTCDDLWFDDQPNLNCTHCHVKCATCETVFDNCLLCALAHRNPPFCECLPGFYED